MNVWVEAARPKTLVAGFVPVVVGTAAAGTVIWWRSAAALVASVATQVAVNYANDYFDAVKGVDRPDRRGPRRVTASGLVTPRQMRTAIAAALAVASVAGLALAAVVGPEIVVVGLVSFAAALGYSGGPRPYASMGLGELSVFVFFGLVATAGSAYVQVDRIVPAAVAASVPVGLIAVAILTINNIRDIEGDEAAGKHTLAVRLGAERSRVLYRALLLGPFLSLPGVAMTARSPLPALAAAALPFALPPLTLAGRRDVPSLVQALLGTARLHLVFGLLLAAGLWLA